MDWHAMRHDLERRLRPALPWLASGALVVLAVLALQSMVARDDRIVRALQDEIAQRLEDRIDVWEADLLPTLDRMVATAASSNGPAPAVLEGRWRAEHAWFDALYVWEVGAPPSAVSGQDARLVFPRTTPALPDAGASACATQLVAAWADGDPAAPLPGLRRPDCPRQDDRAWAALVLSRRLAESDRPRDALEILSAGPADDPELRIQQQVHRADVLDALGEGDEATDVRRRTAWSIGNLDAPQLERVLYLLPGLLDQLDRNGGNARLLRERLRRAEERLAAWREIQQAARRPSAHDASVGARFSWDQYSETPYLLYSRQPGPNTPGVALLLREDTLVQDFLETVPGLRDALSVVDITGRRVLGAVDPAPDGPVVPFADTVRHLQLRVSTTALASRLRPVRGAARLWIAGIVGVCIMLGIGALWAQAAANRSHRLLLQRQRDFTARVTHELKTPLAGIKVMAENLSIGAFRDESQREEWAERIVDEADRLTARVNEILQLSARRSLPEPERFDIEEPLLDLVEQWAPRYEQAGVRFLADLAPVDEMLGDPIAIRDAVSCLLDNALKYRRDDLESAVWLNVRQEGRTIEVEVLDNGLGVPRDQRTAIFEKFVRVEGPNRGKSGGHGLGLAQVAEIARAHDGQIRCETGVDGGSRFVLCLPAVV